MIKNLIDLIRVKQWYKNLIIFLPLVFAENLFNVRYFLLTVIGFISLCAVSSSYYIINDIIDREKDKKHPEKKLRPIASGKIKIWQAIILAIVSFVVAIVLAINLSFYFTYFVLGLFLLTMLYSFFLKNEPFLDILVIAINFVIRAVSGAFVFLIDKKPYVIVSPWLILCPFFLSIFLSVGKRESDLKFLGEEAASHRKVLNIYNKDLTRALMLIATTLLIITYSLYVFFSEFKLLLLTLPVALYIIFRYFYLIESGSKIARHTELIYKDKRIVIAILIMIVIIYFAIY